MSQADFEKWEARYRSGWEPAAGPTDFVVSAAPHLPKTGRALDVGGGVGRHALWLARQGLTVTLLDISPAALQRAAASASREGLTIRTQLADLDRDSLPDDPWDAIVMTFFLWRPLFECAPAALAPGGLLIVEHPTRRNLERHAKPGSGFLLEEGELRRLASRLEVLRYEEGWTSNDRHTARLLARPPAR